MSEPANEQQAWIALLDSQAKILEQQKRQTRHLRGINNMLVVWMILTFLPLIVFCLAAMLGLVPFMQ